MHKRRESFAPLIFLLTTLGLSGLVLGFGPAPAAGPASESGSGGGGGLDLGNEKTSSTAAAASSGVPGTEDATAVWISRPDGAKSCEPGTAKSLAEGAQDLQSAKIPILNSKKARDRKLHAQMCGASTGGENSFLIPREKLKQAQSLGYQVKDKPKGE